MSDSKWSGNNSNNSDLPLVQFEIQIHGTVMMMMMKRTAGATASTSKYVF